MPRGKRKKKALLLLFYREKKVFFFRPRSGLYLIEQVAEYPGSSMSKCPYGVGFTREGSIVALYCGKWSCDRCRKSLAKKWAWRARLHINTTQMDAWAWHFTLPGYVKTPYQGFRMLPKIWDNLRRIMEKCGAEWTYLAFVECHPHRAKIPHFHCISMVHSPLLGSHVSQPLKDLAVMAGFGYYALEEPVTSARAGYYVSKYASKYDPAIPRNFRRCRASQDWLPLPERELEPYLVRGKSETLGEFCVRVADTTGISPDQAYLRYTTACNQWELINYDG